MRQLVREHWRFFALLTTAALALRMGFVFLHPTVAGDAFFYGDLAKNWLQHGMLGTTDANGIHPSIVRLPGYPAFMALVWKFAGVEHYRAILLVQALIDTATCFAVADLARRTRGARAAKVAFVLAALCPFTANYAACALTETLAIFSAALAFDFAVAALASGRNLLWAACGVATAAGMLLRPDGGIVLASTGTYAVVRSFLHGERNRARILASITVFALVALAPLVPWTIRNWRTFHVVQPLAPRYANAPGQFVPLGFQRWVKTWMADYVSVSEVYWAEGEEPLDINKLPARAFDNSSEHARTEQLFAAYNAGGRSITPEVDEQFAQLAQSRIHSHPLRYYAGLPALRIADMWLRPRTEMLGMEDRWWRIEDDPHDSAIAIGLGLLNLFYVGAALVAIRMWWHAAWTRTAPGQAGAGFRCFGLLLAFVLARSLFLGTLENPEPRYTLECYPMVVVMAAAALARHKSQRASCADQPTPATVAVP